jgi:hypothetical protein
MHALPDNLTRLTPEQLLAAYDRTPTGPLYAELLRRLRQIPAAEAEVRRLRAALQSIQEMAEHDLARIGTDSTFLHQIEADARAALAPTADR